MIIGSVVYGIQLSWGCVVSVLVCLTSSGFSSGLFFSVGGFLTDIYLTISNYSKLIELNLALNRDY